MTLQYKYNMHTLSRNMKFIWTLLEAETKVHQMLAFLAVSKARTNKFYICPTKYVYLLFIQTYKGRQLFVMIGLLLLNTAVEAFII